jgi:enamine deaminase RidA (YjgF/YER057c/UK114 family)
VQRIIKKEKIVNRENVIPEQMQKIVDRAGYVPAVRVGDTIYLAGQVGRREDLQVIEDPAEQFQAMWENLRIVLTAAGCVFEDVVEMTTYHVDMSRHMDVFRLIKDQVLPRGTCAWTCVGVTELAHPGLLAEVKCVAVRQG